MKPYLLVILAVFISTSNLTAQSVNSLDLKGTEIYNEVKNNYDDKYVFKNISHLSVEEIELDFKHYQLRFDEAIKYLKKAKRIIQNDNNSYSGDAIYEKIDVIVKERNRLSRSLEIIKRKRIEKIKQQESQKTYEKKNKENEQKRIEDKRIWEKENENSNSTNKNNQWAETFDIAVSNAKLEKKNILIYFSGSDWSPPDVRIKQQFFSSNAFKNISAKLILYNADFPKRKVNRNKIPLDKQQKNQALKQEYNVSAFPTVIIIDNSGNEQERKKGFNYNSNKYLQMIKKHIKN